MFEATEQWQGLNRNTQPHLSCLTTYNNTPNKNERNGLFKKVWSNKETYNRIKHLYKYTKKLDDYFKL